MEMVEEERWNDRDTVDGVFFSSKLVPWTIGDSRLDEEEINFIACY